MTYLLVKKLIFVFLIYLVGLICYCSFVVVIIVGLYMI